jgi:hypothetical protein
MDTSTHSIATLFLQMGLPEQPEAIDTFIRDHHPLAPVVALPDAGFWTQSQAAFLREAIEDDSDWCEVVDELDSRLRA